MNHLINTMLDIPQIHFAGLTSIIIHYYQTILPSTDPGDLKAIYSCRNNKTLAIELERFIKKQKSRKLIQSIIEGRILTGVLAKLVKVQHVRDRK